MQLKTWLVIGILRFQKSFDADVFLDFQIKFWFKFFGIFGLEDCSKKNWSNFFLKFSFHSATITTIVFSSVEVHAKVLPGDNAIKLFTGVSYDFSK